MSASYHPSLHTHKQYQKPSNERLHKWLQKPTYLPTPGPIRQKSYTTPAGFKILYVKDVSFDNKSPNVDGYMSIHWVANMPLHSNERHKREGRSQPNIFATYDGAREALNKWSERGMTVGNRELSAMRRGLWDGQEWSFFP